MDSELINTQLVLVSVRKGRGADHWDKDDYDVRLGDASGGVVGRIFRQPRAPKEQPWCWTITAREQPPSVYNHGYAASREQAMRYFKARYVGPRSTSTSTPIRPPASHRDIPDLRLLFKR